MEDPGISIFTGLGVGDSENQEEAEDLEEQIRRREELQNLLTHELDEFKYEDSTVNSSTNISLNSIGCIEQTYGEAQTPYEQLKLLYNIRMKEIQSLKEEFDNYKSHSIREIDNLKRKLTLQEAETSQVEISWRNTKSILVEKMEIITKQDTELALKTEEIEKLKNIIEKLQFDVQAHKTTLEELNLKLSMNTGPFNVAARAFNSEELQNNHKEQVEKLESFLEEHKKKVEILSKEKVQLEEDLQKKIENNEENEKLYNKTIALLNDSVESAQNQCKDLLNLVEILSKENDHFKGRIQNLEAGDPIILSNSFKRKSLDYETLLTHNERLKKMLLDKDFELSTLKSKVKFYEADVRELIEYRKIRHKSVFNNERSQSELAGNIAVMQYELNNAKSELIDKEKEIIELTSINKELENKIETMIIQTRNELEIISNKYKVPELETMKAELQNTEMKIKELQQKLVKAENEAGELRIKIQENNVKLKEKEKKVTELEEILHDRNEIDKNNMLMLDENEKLRKELEQAAITLNDKQYCEKIEAELFMLKQEYIKITDQYKDLTKVDQKEYSIEDMLNLRADIENFWNMNSAKEIQNDLMAIKIYSWINQLTLNCKQIQKMSASLSDVMKNCKELRENLQKSQNKIQELTETIEKLNNLKIIWEDEKKKMELDYNVLQEELNKNNKEVDDLKRKIKENEKELIQKNEDLVDMRGKIISSQDKNTTTQTFEDRFSHLEETKQKFIKYQEEIYSKSEIIVKKELKIAELETEFDKVLKNFEMSQKEVQRLQSIINEAVHIKKAGTPKEDGDKYSPDVEYLLKAELLKAEVSIREELQKDYQRKISKIEDNYKNIFTVNQQKLNKYKQQENNYRHQLADVLSKYAQIISPVQKENETLKEHITKIEAYCKELSAELSTTKKEFNNIIEKTRTEAQKSIDEWKIWAKTFVQGCLSIEKVNAETRNTILNSLQVTEAQVESIDKYFEEKIKQYKKKNKLSKS